MEVTIERWKVMTAGKKKERKNTARCKILLGVRRRYVGVDKDGGFR